MSVADIVQTMHSKFNASAAAGLDHLVAVERTVREEQQDGVAHVPAPSTATVVFKTVCFIKPLPSFPADWDMHSALSRSIL